ncbi:hypothetical protein [Kinneretia aquatilis]|uniref:hypothetical protein n=1 Tax=Kinneretia aquatilis TaxID=2070761 RepID=UPI001495286F|nr:hypothetical protein [Paucibacter aquatile]WIV99693.1 hypothetical protein K9V56_009570 [Paucibacter aquatile]
MSPEGGPPEVESELTFEELARAALEGLEDLAAGEVMEGTVLEEALRLPHHLTLMTTADCRCRTVWMLAWNSPRWGVHERGARRAFFMLSDNSIEPRLGQIR